MSRTGTLGRLFGQAAEPAIELHPQDLARRGWKAGDLLRVQSRRGEMVLPVQPSDSVAPAQAFIAMHWGEEFVSGRARDGSVLTGVNALSTSAFCPTSKQPELKHAAIRLEAAALPWQLLAAAWLPAELMLQRRQAVQALLQGCGYFSALPCGHEPDGRIGLVLRAADPTPMAAERLQALEALLGLQGAEVLRYADPQRGQHRAMRLAEGGEQAPLQAFVLAGDIRARDWVLPLWRDAQPARTLGTRLLAASPQAAGGLPAARRAGVQLFRCRRGADPPHAGHAAGRRRRAPGAAAAAAALRHQLRLVQAGAAHAGGPMSGGGMNNQHTHAGSVTLVGAGPGDPELLTLKAIKALRQATVLLVDDLVDDGVLRYARRSARIVHVGKRGGCPSTPQSFIHKLMIAEAQARRTRGAAQGRRPLRLRPRRRGMRRAARSRHRGARGQRPDRRHRRPGRHRPAGDRPAPCAGRGPGHRPCARRRQRRPTGRRWCAAG